MNLNHIRHHLHQHPELSGNEHQTQQYIKNLLLSEFQLDGTPVGGTGLLYHFNFGAGPSVLVRVDIDALPIQEENTFEHQSKSKGVAHKCGHDGHTTIGIGLIEKLVKQPLPSGQVTVLFQPAEEIGEGANMVIKDSKFDISKFNYALALHNIPGLPLHQVAWKTGTFTMAVQSLIIRFKGKTSHAALPLGGNNPTEVIANLLLWAKQTEILDDNNPNYHLLTPVHVAVGTPDYGICPGSGEIHFTLRSKTQEGLNRAMENLKAKVSADANAQQLEISFETLATFAANTNHDFVVEQLIDSCKTLQIKALEKAEPFSWGEDFGLFTQHIPGAMFGLGAGEKCPALHHPTYDFPNEIIETGVNLFYQTVKNIITHEQ